MRTQGWRGTDLETASRRNIWYPAYPFSSLPVVPTDRIFGLRPGFLAALNGVSSPASGGLAGQLLVFLQGIVLFGKFRPQLIEPMRLLLKFRIYSKLVV